MNAAQLPAMILAAGRGERMRPLTDACPKPMLAVRGKPLMQWTLEALLTAGVRDVTVNTAWLGRQIEDYFSAARLAQIAQSCRIGEPIRLRFSREGRDFGRALETAGGIARALPLLAQDSGDAAGGAFWAVAGDVFAPGFAFAAPDAARFLASGRLAHLWLAPNPPHHPQGDFGISRDGLALDGPSADGARYTFSAIALYRRELFAPPWCNIPPGNPQGVAAPLAPLLRRAIAAGRVGAQLYPGRWTDVGAPERLAQLNTPAPFLKEHTP
ncbi:MAG: nucleotidyltransferase family protein [Burkholderiaceae bacterium]|jgi:MurNAc alpha-1-phosphate uridylyltransferase|nr:nucleotidyltransferase family protein [Burkholderiaceae bacterium]